MTGAAEMAFSQFRISLTDPPQPKGLETRDNDLNVCGLNIHGFSSTAQLLICSTGVCIAFVAHGYFQESLFQLPDFEYGWFATWVQFILYVICAGTERTLTKNASVRKVPWKDYLMISFVWVASMGLSNQALELLNYPTQVLFKSCKIIPVMLMGRAVQGRSYSRLEYVGAVCICCGLALFTLADVQVSPDFSFLGVLVICGALCADAFVGNLQEKVMKQYDAGEVEVVYYSHLIGVFYLLVATVPTGQMSGGLVYFFRYPDALTYVTFFSMCGFVGVLFVMALVKRFGAVVSIIVTSCRKVFTIALSFLLFPKPFSSTYIVAMCLVFGGIAIHVYVKQSPQKNDSRSRLLPR